MKRWQIVATYCGAGPVIGGLVVAAGVLLTERTDATPPLEVVLICVAFAFPFGGLAALGSGVTHALLVGQARPAAVLGGVVAAGLALHTTMALMIGRSSRLLESVQSLAVFAAPAVISAAVLCSTLLWLQRRG